MPYHCYGGEVWSYKHEQLSEVGQREKQERARDIEQDTARERETDRQTKRARTKEKVVNTGGEKTCLWKVTNRAKVGYLF